MRNFFHGVLVLSCLVVCFACSTIQRQPTSQPTASLKIVRDQIPQFDYELDLTKVEKGSHHTALLPISSFANSELNLRVQYPSHSPRQGTYTLDKTCVLKNGEKQRQVQTFESSSFEIKLHSELKYCELDFRFNNSELIYTLKLAPEEERYPFLNQLYAYEDRCQLRQEIGNETAINNFWNSTVPFFTCPSEVQNLTLMAADYESFNLRWKALVGSDMPKQVFDNFDITYEPDWSQMPKLDLVWISSLVWKADFYGAMMAKAVRKQAENGALVKVLYSNLLMEKVDRRFVDRFRYILPNLQVDDYVYRAEHANLLNPIRRLHRSMHAKLFLTYSASDSSKNMVVGGGSNIYDGFLFAKPSNITADPGMINYARRTNVWAHFSDTDYAIRDTKVTEQVLAQLLRLWSRSDSDKLADPTKVNHTDGIEAISGVQEKSWVRNIISVPYTDKKNLEQFYVNMFDSAKRKILLVTPLFRFTKPIADSIRRAFERDVEIEVITNFTVEGTPWPKVHTEMNRKFANKYYGKVKARQWNKYADLMHAKIVKIDDQVAFLGSVNINHRSFYHDIENGVMITGPEALAEVNKQIERYRTDSKPIDEKFQLSIEHQLLYIFIQGLL